MKTFLLLTFTLTWAYWIPCALERLGLLPWTLPEAVPALAGLGTLGPAVAALVVVGRARGRAGTAALLRSLGHRRVGGRWLLAAAVVYPLLLLAAGGLANAFAGAGLAPQPLSAGGLLGLGAILLVTVLGEEIGWRGYALPALQARWSALAASLILGSVWTIWHIPFWILQPTFAQYGWGYMLLNWVCFLAATIYITWLMNNTGSSLFVAVLFHWCFNIVSVGVMQVTASVPAYLLFTAFCWLVSAALLLLFGPRRLTGARPRLRAAGVDY